MGVLDCAGRQSQSLHNLYCVWTVHIASLFVGNKIYSVGLCGKLYLVGCFLLRRI